MGTAALTVTSSQGQTLVPGLTQTLNVPVNSLVLISSFGGVATTSSSTSGFSATGLALVVDGSVVAFESLTPANNAGVVGVNSNWSMSTSLGLSPGSHTIQVMANGQGIGSSAIVSGNSSSAYQGQLTVLVLDI